MLLNYYYEILAFLDRGGFPLYLIAFIAFLMWTLIFARLWYFLAEHGGERDAKIERWKKLDDKETWYALQIRRKLSSEHYLNLRRHHRFIAAMVAACPLLGLLGTVFGMIEVFTVMALEGSSNARAMASGVSKATITTMSGMVAALSGLLVINLLNRKAARGDRELKRALETD